LSEVAELVIHLDCWELSSEEEVEEEEEEVEDEER